MRIASYNIFNGGKKRLGKISKVIKEMNPDICGILEAVNWDNEKHKNVFKKIGYNFFYLAKSNTRHNIVVLSNKKLRTEIIRKNFKHVVMKITTTEKTFEKFEIFFVHLDPTSEEKRLLEIKELNKYLPKNKRFILLGDFNSLSKSDPYNKKTLLDIFQKNNIRKYGIKKLDFRVINKIKKLGLIDVHNHLKSKFKITTPTPINTDLQHIAPIKIDYAFTTKEIINNIIKIETLINKQTKISSDHYPIFLDIKK